MEGVAGLSALTPGAFCSVKHSSSFHCTALSHCIQMRCSTLRNRATSKLFFHLSCPPHAPQRRVVSLVKLLAAAPGSAASLSDDDSLKQLFRAAAGLLPPQSSDVGAVSAAVARATSAANDSLDLPGSTAAAHVSGRTSAVEVNTWKLIRNQLTDSDFV